MSQRIAVHDSVNFVRSTVYSLDKEFSCKRQQKGRFTKINTLNSKRKAHDALSRFVCRMEANALENLSLLLIRGKFLKRN